MLETSRDLLNIIIAISILWLTVFVCWLLWHFISILGNVSKLVGNIRKKMEVVDKILDLVKDKLEKGSSHMALLADSALKLVGFFVDKQKSDPGKKSSKRKK